MSCGDRACLRYCAVLLAGWSFGATAMTPSGAAAAAAPCAEVARGFTSLLHRRWSQQGGASLRIDLPRAAGRHLLVEVTERDIDVVIEVQRADGTVIARADSPVARASSQWAAVPEGGVAVVVEAKEPADTLGRVDLQVLARNAPDDARAARDAATADELPAGDCAPILQHWAAADAAYASGREITLARGTADSGQARTLFAAAERNYAAALDLVSGPPRPGPGPAGPGLAGPGSVSDRGALQLSLAALAYYELQDWAHSAEWAAAAAASAGADAPYVRARAQAILAAAWLELATASESGAASSRIPVKAKMQFARARSLLAALARFHARRHEIYDETLQINNIGLAYFYEARFESAIAYFSRARPVFERIGDGSRAALALQNIALSHWGLGRLTTAVAEFDEALRHIGPTPYPNLYLLTLNNSGLAHFAAGQLDEALRLETEALQFATRSQADRARAHSFYGIGVTYYAIGDRDLAAQFLHSALELCTAKLDARTRVATLRALALIEFERGQHGEAVAHDSEALRLATAPSARARILLRLAQDERAVGDTAAARRILDTLTRGHPPGVDPVVEAMARAQRGGLLRAAGSLQAAGVELRRAIRTFAAYDCLAERFEAQIELAHLLADEGRGTDALRLVRQALHLSRELRVQTANPEYRSSIAQSVRPALEFEVELLRSEHDEFVREGRTQDARRLAIESLQAVDDFRALSFEDWRAQELDQGTDRRIHELISASTVLYHDIAERRFQLATRDDRFGTHDSQARFLREDLAQLRVRLGLVNSELATHAARSPVGADLPVAAVDTQRWFSRFKAKSPDRGFIEYWLGSTHAYAWVIHQGDIAWVSLPASPSIARAAQELHDSLRAPEAGAARRIEECATLYRLAWAPLAAHLGTAHDVIVVPDGALNYIPFAALRDAASPAAPYLVQSFTIAGAPALRLLNGAPPRAAGRSSTAGGRILIVADPVYTPDDARLSHAMQPARLASIDRPVGREALDSADVGRLASTAREARQIQALYRPDQVDLLLGQDATRDNLLAKDLAEYRFIHIASHGIMDAEIPQLSALILSKYGTDGVPIDPYLRTGDLLLRTFNAQAIVLSACDTALGKEMVGEGLIGLRYAALARGAQAVVASLWPVADGISADLMTDMYREVVVSDNAKEGAPARPASQAIAAALSDAMRHLLARTPGLDPRLWAPFAVYVASD